MAFKSIPSRISDRYPSIGEVRTAPFGNPIYSSKTPLADWAGFHFEMEGGVPGSNKGAAPGTARDAFGNLIGSSAPFIKPLTVVKDPAGAAAGDSLLEAFNRYSSQMPDFGALMKGLQDRYNAGQNKVDAAFNEQQAALDPTEWIAQRRGRDAALGALTDRYQSTLGDLSGRYDATLGKYETAGRDIIDEAFANAARYKNEILPEAMQRAIDQSKGYMDKFGIANAGAGGGLNAPVSSGGIRILGDRMAAAILPYKERAYLTDQDLLRNMALPFEGDIANRYVGKIAGFDYPVASDIYNRYGAVNAQERATDDAIYSAKQAAASGKVQSAVAQLMSTGLGIQQMAQILQLPIQLVAQQAQALAGILANRNTSTQFGMEDIRGSNVTMPWSPNFVRQAPFVPDYPSIPGRYEPPAQSATYPSSENTLGAESGPSWSDIMWNQSLLDSGYYDAPPRASRGVPYGADRYTRWSDADNQLVNRYDPASAYYLSPGQGYGND